jgi:hypothetical protein
VLRLKKQDILRSRSSTNVDPTLQPSPNRAVATSTFYSLCGRPLLEVKLQSAIDSSTEPFDDIISLPQLCTEHDLHLRREANDDSDGIALCTHGITIQPRTAIEISFALTFAAPSILLRRRFSVAKR